MIMFYELKEVALICGVQIKTVKKWIREGKVKSFAQWGDKYMIPETELNRLIKNRTNQTKKLAAGDGQ